MKHGALIDSNILTFMMLFIWTVLGMKHIFDQICSKKSNLSIFYEGFWYLQNKMDVKKLI